MPTILNSASSTSSRSREAQRLADEQRSTCLSSRTTFSFETVMSHPSKTDLMAEARAAGFRVTLFFVAVNDPGLNIMRVGQRVSLGGHSVPEDRIVSRYARTLALLPRALLSCDVAVLFDNTAAGSGPQPVANVVRNAEGFQLTVLDSGCSWLRRELLTHLHYSGLLSGTTESALVPEAVLQAVDRRRTADITFP
jgi:predicted ABC-type ATPase